ncbi:GrpB family protein [Sporolactobacillus spathodeae]|uniref:GrpB-like predicted nucleotidyltransferase (UPF0157 family) n=1 Tax=Sporolactobacillus spathodeae TaxID=1465502 RepID=A0ABS2QBA3_9BACL|nr:GrpB-like predicted nucleotidyltransferase (UPF0157 family) [Sporolactobacillus spathodeae]
MSEVKVIPFQNNWEKDFHVEATRLTRIFQPNLSAIHHIGSTAVANLCAKPTIDILLEVVRIDESYIPFKEMEKASYQSLVANGNSGRYLFQKLDESGEYRYQVHVYQEGSPDVVRHLAFRDYLRTHPDIAELYGALKQQLAEAFPDDRDSYSSGKEAAIRRIEDEALSWWYNQ